MNNFSNKLALIVLSVCRSRHLIFPWGTEKAFSIELTAALDNKQLTFTLDLMFLRRPCKISLFLLKACRMVWRVTKKSSYPRRFNSSFSRAAKKPVNEADAMGMFLTVFAVLSLESFCAETLVVVLFVQWETFTFVLARPTNTGRLSKECIVHDYSCTVLY